ncbi:MAG: homoaconitase small subunit [Methanobrevibacter sp.]|nr:homoaconitase small subunit [Methanobrevibacter sp.]
MSEIKGKVWNFGDNIDTDVIIPGRYLRTFDEKELAVHVLEGERADFTKGVQKGDIILAGDNFGCGSSRVQAAVAIKAAGVDVIIAKSFARIFYRNAINIGLPVVTADIEADDGDILSVDLEEGIIENQTKSTQVEIQPFNDFMFEILSDGGIVEHYLKNKE